MALVSGDLFLEGILVRKSVGSNPTVVNVSLLLPRAVDLVWGD